MGKVGRRRLRECDGPRCGQDEDSARVRLKVIEPKIIGTSAFQADDD